MYCIEQCNNAFVVLFVFLHDALNMIDQTFIANVEGGKIMQESSRFIKIDNWSFEVKIVRASRIGNNKSQPTATANCNMNGDTMYVDGLLTQDNQEFSKSDFLSFYKFCKQMKVESCSFHRYQHGDSISKDIKVSAIDKVNKT